MASLTPSLKALRVSHFKADFAGEDFESRLSNRSTGEMSQGVRFQERQDFRLQVDNLLKGG